MLILIIQERGSIIILFSFVLERNPVIREKNLDDRNDENIIFNYKLFLICLNIIMGANFIN